MFTHPELWLIALPAAAEGRRKHIGIFLSPRLYTKIGQECIWILVGSQGARLSLAEPSLRNPSASGTAGRWKSRAGRGRVV
mmetsp:Transcript_2010/g.4755  ORF Transcript_2010/g.4755 Transcript_2010/m.4755 type:complete len:81 (+) Transcript_2010:3547-3789(+)